jgi:hypothetical protein
VLWLAFGTTFATALPFWLIAFLALGFIPPFKCREGETDDYSKDEQ